MKRSICFSLMCFAVLAIKSCTDLDEQYESHLTEDQVANSENSNVDALLTNLRYATKPPFQNAFGGVISLSEITTDILIAPTRGPDWDDNGTWRQLHQHRWNADHSFVTRCFSDLNGVIFAATDLLRFHPTRQQEVTARFYRAWSMYFVLDFFDQVPYRDPGENTLESARVRKGLDALEYIIGEINELMPDLPDGPASEPNKNAAKVLLMKCYLNKGVYANRQFPTFDVADMNKVISFANEVLNANQYSFSGNYFDNFAPNNDLIGRENIFTQENVAAANDSPLILLTIIPLHYASTPFGSNGWAVPSDFYDKFEDGDKRKGQAYNTPEGPPNPGNRINMGFLFGQQYDLFTDEPLSDRTGKPLIFTREVAALETGYNLEVTGIRPQKYAFDYSNQVSFKNDWVYLRLSDVLLMKAEAILRGGNATSAGPYGSSPLELVNAIRVDPSRAASALSSIDLNTLLDERARELWLECWRRQDLIRFGKFLEPFHEKVYVSDPKYLLFPIPSQQMNVNSNLVQNPGY
jgi:starch-binding outer membrane protein, SusD/RagB family